VAAGVTSAGAEAIRQCEADHIPLGTEFIPPFSCDYYYYYYIYHLYAGCLQFFITTDYDVLFIVRNSSGDLNLLIPVCDYLTFTTSFRLILVLGNIIIIIIIIKVQVQPFALF
jgi:hypothetical protein